MHLRLLQLQALCCFSALATAYPHLQCPPSSSPLANCDDLHITDTTGRTYAGYNASPDVRAFLGIPYAQPPVGSLRWKPPQPLECAKPVGQVIDATKFGNSCWQFRYMLFARDPALGEETVKWSDIQTPESEDCLSLNIWTPVKKGKGGKGKGLPVMVWIHGGGHTEGGSSIPVYNGKNIVEEHNDIIVVSINYRLNIFGFPMTPSVPLNRTNLGLFDQRLAVEWLRDNISLFGGDPTKITLFGESAGAMSVVTYMFSYPDDPIAHGFIAQSPYATGDGDPQEFGRVAGNAGCKGSEAQVFECMMKLSGEKVERAVSNKTYNGIGANPGGIPVVDNATWWIQEGYAEQARKGRVAKKPLLVGTTHQEGDSLVPYDIKRGINYTLSDIYTVTIFNCPTALYADILKNQTTTYRYRYMPSFPSASDPLTWPRAYHSSEISIIFNNPVPNIKLHDYEVKATKYIMGAWVAFAKDPENGLKKYKGGWPEYKADKLVELFPGWQKDDNGKMIGKGVKDPLVKIVKGGQWDGQCANPPPVPWDQIIGS